MLITDPNHPFFGSSTNILKPVMDIAEIIESERDSDEFSRILNDGIAAIVARAKIDTAETMLDCENSEEDKKIIGRGMVSGALKAMKYVKEEGRGLL